MIVSTLTITAALTSPWLLSGCSADLTRQGADDVPQPATFAETVPGVEPCSVLTNRAVRGTVASSGALDSRELSCLFPGESFNVASLGGQPVVINLWASWCGPCREEMPILQAVAEDTAGSATFVGVATRDDAASAGSFLRAVGVTYPQLNDPEGGLLGELRSPGLPVTVILRPDGSVLTKHIGPFDDEQQLADLIASAASDQ